MRDFLSVYGRRLPFSFAVGYGCLFAGLIVTGNYHLIGAALLGGAAALVWCWLLASRLWNMAAGQVRQAKRRFFACLLLRLFFVLLLLGIAINISRAVFIAMLCGFLLAYLLLFGQLAVFCSSEADKK